MPARTHTRITHPATGSVGVRLPWWAIALPALAFAALLLLIVGPGEAHADATAPAVNRLLERITALVTR
ncbi:hypothetical protein [Streptomyces sp. NBC_01435]|uniref:hypothetical protein n=1 Tax=Streptomyces sp. NBC_01435 TaxID=2903865 RepID=UPI002E368429|nr:hypothetical protein [Streptomyces sp. NBC_01435]